jgi:hypothetical protein
VTLTVGTIADSLYAESAMATGKYFGQDIKKVEVDSMDYMKAIARDLRIDELELKMLAKLPMVDQPITHTFAGDLYIRSVINPVDSLVTTKIHRTAHPFFVLRGMALVSTNEGPLIEIEAPHWGITQPGTRRAILAIKEIQWMTVHAMTQEERDEPDQDKRLTMIEDRLIERRELLPGKSSHDLFWEKYNKQIADAGIAGITGLGVGKVIT